MNLRAQSDNENLGIFCSGEYNEGQNDYYNLVKPRMIFWFTPFWRYFLAMLVYSVRYSFSGIYRKIGSLILIDTYTQ